MGFIFVYMHTYIHTQYTFFFNPNIRVASIAASGQGTAKERTVDPWGMLSTKNDSPPLPDDEDVQLDYNDISLTILQRRMLNQKALVHEISKNRNT